MSSLKDAVVNHESFTKRHIGPSSSEVKAMLTELGYATLDELTNAAVPAGIRVQKPLTLSAPLTETKALAKLRGMASKNRIFKSYLGTGYYNCITPSVIQRNILENPGWYTQYTPYQAEISQGRLEALLNYQTVIADLTGLPIANASLLDESTAAAEAMSVAFASRQSESSRVFFVSQDAHPQTLAVVRTRAEPLGIEVVVGDHHKLNFAEAPFGVLLQYPTTYGEIDDPSAFIKAAHEAGVMVIMATDLLALTLLKSPGELGADIAIGNAQRFGVPLGFGGPHAAFFATRDEHKRKIPGRLIGVSKDAEGKPALRMALQTREQHIRRDKATSNICTAQVLLAIMSSMYAVYHGPEGLKAIASRVHGLTGLLAQGLKKLGYCIGNKNFFDTLSIAVPLSSDAKKVLVAAEARSINLRYIDVHTVALSLDETVTISDVDELLQVFASAVGSDAKVSVASLSDNLDWGFDSKLSRTSPFLTHPVFSSHHSETQLLRYIRQLESRDLSLTRSMIPLGSCTMKLNATSELMPVTWPDFNSLHPFAPQNQTLGYQELFAELECALRECTGFDGVSLQPNSGAQGEFAGLLVIRQYHLSNGQHNRNICLIPKSAHGTNPASAVMAGMKVVVVECDANGNIDEVDLNAKVEQHSSNLAALMVTYPSTHGVFEESITRICQLIHKHGGQVYMDGANFNAQLGLCKPGEFGPDVCHLNLHKTFCIPHGGGGPGMGPIAVKGHLAPFLPGHPLAPCGGDKASGPISAAPWGSASILPISMMYIWMMGARGLTEATQVAILNANYIAKKLQRDFPVLYRGASGLVAHECIIDLRPLKAKVGIEVEDVAKRLMDYGFHAPTVSFPVAGTLMIEPTESEDKAEIDRFCDAMHAIRLEIQAIEDGQWPRDNNPLKHAPHTAACVMAESWSRPYSRQQAAYPAKWVGANKFWPFVARIDSAYGDRNLVCTCDPIDQYRDEG
ncbi:MAG: aminomethyl-transferring glycine dehydrogenase [Deltaproteobacteria bacterium]|nr:aminomethyl-transferring glycine dehydrogenase [Deltaproteobacteria bacterium]